MAESGETEDFPEATLLLCSFHVLQAVWRWLWNKEHGIHLADRKTHHGIMYASEAQGFYGQVLENSFYYFIT